VFANAISAKESYDSLSLDLDSLMATDVQATSAMKRSQSAFDTASSIYVLSKEQIERANVASIPDALKLVPGLVVRQLDNNQWAISARGIASRFSSKLLVMIDGQSLYTPKFATVYWEALNIPLYDIERIEVMRGHGGVLWGSNANNGVINIITKESIDSRGSYAEATTGKNINTMASVRYGNDLANKLGSYRFYASVKNTPASEYGTEIEANDETHQSAFGTRVDFTLDDNWFALIQANYSDSTFGQNYQDFTGTDDISSQLSETVKRHDARIMARLNNRISNDADQMFQLSWVKQQGKDTFVKENFHIYDLDYQMNFVYQNMKFDWGLNYRYNDISLAESRFITSDTNIKKIEQYGVFLQSQFNFLNDELSIILGNKLEYNEFTQWENQPLFRVTLQPTSNQNFWGAISSSVRPPSLFEYDNNAQLIGVEFSSISPVETGIEKIDTYFINATLNGNANVESEKYTSYELGYRFKTSNWSLDLSTYYTKGSNIIVVDNTIDLEQFDPIASFFVQGLYDQAYDYLTTTSLTFDLTSSANSTTEGYELLFAYSPSNKISTELGYSYIFFKYHLAPNTVPAIGKNSTTKQVFAKANYTPMQNHNIFATLRYEKSNAYYSDNYTALDISWNWQISTIWTAAISGKNVLAGKHLEYANRQETYAIPNYIDDDFILKITARF
jgi:iron complex outermembrane receptor protein